MSSTLLHTQPETAFIPIYLLTPDLLTAWQEQLSVAGQDLIAANKFNASAGSFLLVPTRTGNLVMLAGLGGKPDEEAFGTLAVNLPAGSYVLGFAPSDLDRTRLARAWIMGGYCFEPYQKQKSERAAIYIAGANTHEAKVQADAVFLARDLINTPASDMGPAALQAAIEKLGERFGAKVHSIIGEELLAQGYPMIHAVGRAADEPPRLVHLCWGSDEHPGVSLVGKGVIFDTGGLNIKPGRFMGLMKKDMGGAANALATAQLIMQANLPVFLNVFIPIADNAISGNAYRPSDVLPSRLGLSVEVENTDAEGRLILADALCRAVEDAPELLINFATLTGAARTALGPELAPYYSTSDTWAAQLESAAKLESDPVWRMPLWDGYDSWLKSDIADVCHTSSSPMAGSITAALFLRKFIADTPFMHFDIYGWAPKDRPAHPAGGTAQGPFAVFCMLREAFADD